MVEYESSSLAGLRRRRKGKKHRHYPHLQKAGGRVSEAHARRNRSYAYLVDALCTPRPSDSRELGYTSKEIVGRETGKTKGLRW
jgi:hypothetical protein